MSNGFYTAASSMLNAQRKLGVLSNNMANISTPGYRSQNIVTTAFEQELIRLEGGKEHSIGKGAPIQLIDEVVTNFEAGAIKETNRPFDFAIVGEGYFNIAEPSENTLIDDDRAVYLTRNGSFDIDSEGYLILKDVGRVQGQKGDIKLKGSDFAISANGTIFEDGKQVDRILLSKISEDAATTKYGKGMIIVENQDQIETVEYSEMIQGAVELSNVDINQEMIRVMEAQRSFQAASSALKIVDRMNQKAVTEIGSL